MSGGESIFDNHVPVYNISVLYVRTYVGFVVVSSKAMSGGGELITEDSLFAFDDAFGDGSNCLQAASVLTALSSTGESMCGSVLDSGYRTRVECDMILIIPVNRFGYDAISIVDVLRFQAANVFAVLCCRGEIMYVC